MSEHQGVREAEPLTLPEAQALGQDLLGELLDAAGDPERTQAVLDSWADELTRPTDLLSVAAGALVELFRDRVVRRPDGRIEVTEVVDDA